MDKRVNTTIAAAVAAGLSAAAASPNIAIQPRAVEATTDAVLAKLQPAIVNLANAEPWYQSRVTWGVIVAGIATIAKPFIGELPISAEQTADIVNALATAGQAFGLAFVLYGRWRARKPIGG